MRHARVAGWGLAAIALGAGGCQQLGAGPTLEAAWTGSDTGRIAVRPSVAWCEGAGVLTVAGVREDLGFGLAIYPNGEPQGGAYPVFDPGVDTTTRPGVAAAARWFTETALQGFQSDSGALELQARAGALEGLFQFRMRSLDGKDTIDVQGRLRGIRPGPCRLADSVAPAPGIP